MTYADGMKGQVKAIAGEAQRAIVRGQNALTFTESALGAIAKAEADLGQVQLQVRAEIDVLEEKIIPSMTVLFANSLSQDVSTSIDFFKKALKELKEYHAHLEHRRTVLQQTLLIIKGWKETELEMSGASILEAMRLLAEYNSRL